MAKKKIIFVLTGLILTAIIIAVVLSYFPKPKTSEIKILSGKGDQPFRQTVFLNLDPQKSDTVYFRKSGWGIKKIEFRFKNLKAGEELSSDAAGQNIKLEAELNLKDQKSRNEDWSNLEQKVFCLEDKNSDLQSLKFKAVNLSENIILQKSIEVLAFKEGCKNWSGHLSINWREESTVPNKNQKFSGQGSFSAVFTLIRDPYSEGFYIQDGGYSYSLLNQDKTWTDGCDRVTITRQLTLGADGELGVGFIRLIPVNYGVYELKIVPNFGLAERSKETTEKEIYSCLTKKVSKSKKSKVIENAVLEIPNEIFSESLLLNADALGNELIGERQFKGENGRIVTASWDIKRQ